MQHARGRRPSPRSAAAEPIFPPRQALVVHFRADSDATEARCTGRVEHVLSGRGALFRSAADLLAAMQRLLHESRRADDAPPATPTTSTPPAGRGRRTLARRRREARTPR